MQEHHGQGSGSTAHARTPRQSTSPHRARASASPAAVLVGCIAACAAVASPFVFAAQESARRPAVGNPHVSRSGQNAPEETAGFDAATLALGEEIYRSQCQPCHGREGKGDGPAARFVDPKPRDLTAGKWQYLRQPTVAEIARIVTHGVPDTGMEPFEELLTEEEIRAVAAYVLQRFAPKPEDTGSS